MYPLENICQEVDAFSHMLGSCLSATRAKPSTPKPYVGRGPKTLNETSQPRYARIDAPEASSPFTCKERGTHFPRLCVTAGLVRLFGPGLSGQDLSLGARMSEWAATKPAHPGIDTASSGSQSPVSQESHLSRKAGLQRQAARQLQHLWRLDLSLVSRFRV